MSCFPRRVALALVVACAAIGLLTPTAQADWTIGNCNSDTLIGNTVAGTATLTVDGVPKTGAVDYAAQVCKSSSGLYNFMVGPLAGGVINEAGTLSQAGKVYVLSFTMTGSDMPTSAEVYGSMAGYAISGQTVTLTGSPGAMTQINYGGGSIYAACMSAPFTGSYSGGLCSGIPCWPTTADCVDDSATFHGGVRFASATSPTLTGMYISSSVNLYQVALTNCSGVAYGRRKPVRPRQEDGGANRPTASLSVQMIGPHYTTAGAINSGALQAFIPFALMRTCFGADATTVATQLGVSRTEDTLVTQLTNGGQVTVTGQSGGLLVRVPTVTFSQPTYAIAMPRAASGTTTPLPAAAATTTKLTGVTWKTVKGVVTARFTKGATVTSYAITSTLKTKASAKIGACVIKKTKVTCTVKRLTKGSWTTTITSKLKAGGAGPTATKVVKIA